MRASPFTILAAGGLLLALAGCHSASRDIQPDFGAALTQNKLAQIADPDAVYQRDLPPGSDGERAVRVQQDYEGGTAPVLKVEGTGASE